VISVDTAVLHLAGAMGKPAWLLNRFHTDWRWQYTSSDSLWYPTLRIFRQKKFGAWSPVVKKAASALKKWLAANANEALWKLLDPPRPDAAFNLALAFSRGRKADEALHVLDILEKKHPEFAWQFALRGKILRSEGRGAEAVEALSRAVTLGIEAPAIVAQLGMALADAGMKDEAFKVLAESGKADSDDAMVNHYLGNLLRDLGKTAEARRFFEKAIEANPRLTESLDALECLLREEGDTAAADAAFARKEDIRGRIDRYRAAMKDCEAALFGIHS
jgi:predicted Zn-dependent protease